MAVTTVDSVVADVVFMAELNWLLSFDPLARVPRRAVQLDRDPKCRDKNKSCAIDRDFRERVCAVVENLHRRRVNCEL